MTLRILSFTTLYPNAEQPVHGIFVENRLRRLVESGEASVTVVAPVPWFPFKGQSFGTYGAYARVPHKEHRHGIDIYHPRYKTLPKVGMNVAPRLMYEGVRSFVMKLVANEGPFDIIDAHYFYPDGITASMLSDALDLPICITARGTDLNLIPQFDEPRQQIQLTASYAGAIITVCDALQQPLLDMGIDPGKITTLRNGVDLDMFTPHDRAAARAHWDVEGPTLVSVGGLNERKGHHLIIEALTSLPDATLLIAGGGRDESQLKKLAQSHGLANRVRFLGVVPHEELASLYSAADVLVLASSREGWANVLLEAMACGTPVVATDIWGTGEVVTAPEAGLLIEERSAAAIAEGVSRLLADVPDRATTRSYAEQFSWEPTTQGQLDIFRRLIAQ